MFRAMKISKTLFALSILMILSAFYNGKCSSEETATTAKCIQPLMQCWKGPSDSEFSCNFDLQSFMMEGGKCVPNPSRCNPNW